MVLCEGGNTITENNHTIHFFKTTGISTLTVIEGGLVEVLVVAGGGGGGNGSLIAQEAGGGGAGGLIYSSNFYLTAPANISVTVGAGGIAATNGGNSIFSTLTAIGGGAGGTAANGALGGSGGGGAYGNVGSVGTANQGNSGGAGSGTLDLAIRNVTPASGGGGGGAGFPGNTNFISFGGDGLYFPQFSNVGGSPPGWFAAGGQGGTTHIANKKYRSYGGGGYAPDVANENPYPGVPNTGGGGGGRFEPRTQPGAAGGSGIVIIRYRNYISQTVTTYLSDLQLAFGGTNPIYFSEYYANSTPNYTSNIRNIPNSGNMISMSQFRNNDNSMNFNTYSYHGIINSNCNSLAIDLNSNVYFTDNTNFVSKLEPPYYPTITGTNNVIIPTFDNPDFSLAFFSTSGTFTVNKNLICDILVVGGGGAGKTQIGGGGGGGAVVYVTGATITPGTYNVVVGLGAQTEGTKGNNSSFVNIIAEGGGAGGTFGDNLSGGIGGSGGGAGCDGTDGNPYNFGGVKGTSSSLGGFTGTIYGNNGGDALARSGGLLAGGGGGGAGQVGGNGNIAFNCQGGVGGNGIQINIDGRNLYWGGGGGGSSYFNGNNRGGNGGLGGGGGGSCGNGSGTLGIGGVSALNSGENATASTLKGGDGGANTGGGGGGGGWANSLGGWGPGGLGGSGVVIVRFSNTNKTLNSTFYNIGVPYSKICILNNDLYLAYFYNDPTPAYSNGTPMTNNYIRMRKMTLTSTSPGYTSDILFADRLHHSYIPPGDTAFWPSGYPGPMTINPNGDIYLCTNTSYWWTQQHIIKIASNGTKSLIYSEVNDAGALNRIVYSLAPTNNSVGFYTIQSNNFNFMNDAGTITNLFSMGNPDCRIVRYLSSRMILFNRTSMVARIYDFNSSSITETVQLYNVDFKEMCRSSTNDVFIFNTNSQRILIRNGPNDGSSSRKAAASGWHLAKLNTSLNLQLTNGYYWIKSDSMPNALQMYVNFTADGGGYDFYIMTGATSRNYIYQRTGAEKLGLDLFYPRSKAHWAAIHNFVVTVSGNSLANVILVPGKVYRVNGIGNYTPVLMRDPRFFSSGAPDWMVPDGGQWFIRDASYSEPNGDYVGYTYLGTWNSRLFSDGTVEFNDGNYNYFSGTTILCSTNFKGSLFDVSTNDGSTSALAALSGWHLSKFNKTYKLNLPSGIYWIKSSKMTNALQMYVDMTREEGGYDFYRYTTATSCNLLTQSTGADTLGLSLFHPRSKEHWAAIYNYVVNICGSTIANDVKTVGTVHKRTSGGNYSTTIMRSSIHNFNGTNDWRVPDYGNWYIRDTVFNQPSGNYTAYAYLELTELLSDGTVASFADNDAAIFTGTTIICSTNVKGYSYYN